MVGIHCHVLVWPTVRLKLSSMPVCRQLCERNWYSPIAHTTVGPRNQYVELGRANCRIQSCSILERPSGNMVDDDAGVVKCSFFIQLIQSASRKLPTRRLGEHFRNVSGCSYCYASSLILHASHFKTLLP